ncbi:unannotated protein [freshwater metagenome]|uniref:Unannotated protein n=1 Tax=freshwater metagenome TaxID=449393 RepID=A0A6J6FUM9_9ZZZZ
MFAKRDVTGDGTRFQKGLKFPRFSPAIPVRLVRLHSSHKGTVATFGSKICINAKTSSGDVHDGARSAIKFFAWTFANEQHINIA